MTIAEAKARGKALVARVPKDALVLGVLVGASSASFGLGYLAGQDAQSAAGPIAAELTQTHAGLPTEASTKVGEGSFVASKNGSKYYLATCSGAKRISEANKVWFDTTAAAVAAGYAPAANCPGL